MRLRSVRAVFGTAAIASTLLVGVAGAPVSATAAYTFNFVVNANDFSGTGPPSDSFTITVFNGATAVDSTVANTNGSGRYQAFFASGGQLKSGWRVEVTDGGPALRILTVPNLTADVDRVTDVVSGVAPANQALRVQTFDCIMSEQCTLTDTRTPTSSASGQYSLDFTSTFDIRGNDIATTRLITTQGDRIQADRYVTAFGADPAGREMFGCVPSNQVTFRLFSAPGGTLIEKHKAVDTENNACFHQPFNSAFASGRQVTASMASDAKITIPNTQASHVGTVATVRCLPNRPVFLEWFSDFMHHITGNANSTGRFVRDLAIEDPGVTMTGLELRIQCETPKGDRLEFRRTLPA